eukprot:TRINITY_DN16521_c0_g1_i1.p2 TRINITY_DN16521_c0_g1~~TRINITY_DN16521_c0_g1_i1.p2  ORF type:complete len:117 (-),score=6.96 TRINITY_DN16521_c0_g1_i1:321-671(-)
MHMGNCNGKDKSGGPHAPAIQRHEPQLRPRAQTPSPPQENAVSTETDYDSDSLEVPAKHIASFNRPVPYGFSLDAEGSDDEPEPPGPLRSRSLSVLGFLQATHEAQDLNTARSSPY